jgi:hypothetical protein
LAAVLAIVGARADVAAGPDADEEVGAAAGMFDDVLEGVQAVSANATTITTGVRNLVRYVQLC